MADQGLIEVLLVEDSPSDARLIESCFRESKVANRVHCVASGAKALEFLHRSVQYSDAPRPDLVILDLGLPDMDGLDILQAVKADPNLKPIPVIVLTSSAIVEDVHRAYDLQAACYFSKPLDFEGFQELVCSIEEVWLRLVRLPGDQVTQVPAGQ